MLAPCQMEKGSCQLGYYPAKKRINSATHHQSHTCQERWSPRSGRSCCPTTGTQSAQSWQCCTHTDSHSTCFTKVTRQISLHASCPPATGLIQQQHSTTRTRMSALGVMPHRGGGVVPRKHGENNVHMYPEALRPPNQPCPTGQGGEPFGVILNPPWCLPVDHSTHPTPSRHVPGISKPCLSQKDSLPTQHQHNNSP